MDEIVNKSGFSLKRTIQNVIDFMNQKVGIHIHFKIHFAVTREEKK